VTDLPAPPIGLVAPDSSPTRAAASFEAMLGEVLGSAFGTALRLVPSRADAEALVQAAAVEAFHRRAACPVDGFKVWFFGILVRCYRAAPRRDAVTSEAVDWDDTPDLYLYARSYGVGLPVSGPDPAARLLDALGPDRMAAAVERLPEPYRLLALLYFMDDFSYQEIAAILDCPAGSVRSRLHRGRKMLQKAIWQEAEASGAFPAPGPGAGA
jgi:RNA polymerase sigma-70 factor (ECF subfamily)